MTEISLDAYFQRIGWGGATNPTYDTLAGLLRAHVSMIPFENFDVLLGRGVPIDLASLQNKLVFRRRGGYCFEQATLFAAVLEQLGFRVARHLARVILLQPMRESPLTHMILTVLLPEGTFIVDPGFGFLTARVPIPLLDGVPAHGDHETHWMIRSGNLWTMRAQVGDTPTDAWVTALREDYPVDFEVSNHFVATHPGSPFVNRIMLSAITADGRFTAMNRDAKLWKGAVPEPFQIADRRALRQLLIEHCGIDEPAVETLRVPTIPEWDA